METIIDGTNCILGRFASEVAKRALSNEKIIIINSEKIAISGRKKAIIEKYLERRRRGTPQHGPFFPRRPDMLVRRTIKSMLPYKTQRGKEAYKKIIVYIGVPEELKNKDFIKLGKNIYNLNCDFIYVGELCKYLGWKEI